MKKNGQFKSIITFIIGFVIVIALATMILGTGRSKPVNYSEIIQLFKDDKIEYFEIKNDNTLHYKTTEGEENQYRLIDLNIFYNDTKDYINKNLEDGGHLENYTYEEPVYIPWYVSILPYVIVFLIIIGLWYFAMSRAMGGGPGKISNFGKARAKSGHDQKKKVFFKDVAGCDEEKEELQEVVEFLKNPNKFSKLGAKIPHGVLLVGPPGTGKTLLAKAVAGEADVPFLSISGSDFVEMYVGVGASRVRDLFDSARKHPASIIFIDEIDAVGRHRGAGLGGGHDEREQTLNQMLVEMDGFGTDDGVVVIAATNRPDILDPALLRPGRFDRQITVNLPDIKGREAILKVHAQNKPLEKTVDLNTIAKTTAGFSGADLANLINEAALLAARKGKNLIGMEEMETAVIKVVAGPEKKSKVITPEDKKITAYHEAGHAIVTNKLSPRENVHYISIIPAGMAGGYTLSLPKEDRSYYSKNDLENEIAILMGGRTAEELIIGDISTGASNDLERATGIARNMVIKYGMSNLGNVVFGSNRTDDEVFLGRDFSSSKNYSEDTAGKIDSEIERFLNEGHDIAVKVLKENLERLHFIAGFLIENENMEEYQFVSAMEDTSLTYDDLRNMKEEHKKRSAEENKNAPIIETGPIVPPERFDPTAKQDDNLNNNQNDNQ